MNEKTLLDDLNPAQRTAVLHGEGPLLVLAGAGSGKTRVITYRIARLILSGLAEPEEILAVTFTNKAAGEMKTRIDHLLGREMPGLWVSTFHSSCARILRIEGAPDGLGRHFQIYDTNDQLAVMKRAVERLELNPELFQPRRMLSRFSRAKNLLIGPATYTPSYHNRFGDEEKSLFTEYQRQLVSSGAVDFDDLLLLTVQLLREKEGVGSRYRRRFRYLLVDEFQDTNRAQYELVRELSGSETNVCAVGDEDQSIYRWRGAEVRNILEFEKHFSGTTLVKLEQNYRSTGMILDAAGSVIRNNRDRKDKRLWTAAGDGDRLRVLRTESDLEEARRVVDTILEERATIHLDQMAILYRMNYQSRVLEDALRAAEVPYQIVAGLSFYERKEIKDLVAYLRLTVNPRDDLNMRRIFNTPPRGLGKKTLQHLMNLAEAESIPLRRALAEAVSEKSGRLGGRAIPRGLRDLDELLVQLSESREQDARPAFLMEQVLQRTGYGEYIRGFDTAGPDRMENVEELLEKAREFEELHGDDATLSAFLDQVSLVSESDELDVDTPRIRLMTLHTAKGLEFGLVFIVGLEEGIFPINRDDDDPGELEEERRLFYVGMTRAMRKLVLSWAGRRRIFGQSRYTSRPSRFLDEIPERCLMNPTPSGARFRKPIATTDHSWSPRTQGRSLKGSSNRRAKAKAGPASTAAGGHDAVDQARQFLAKMNITVSDPGPQTSGRIEEPDTGDLVRHPKFGTGRVLRKRGSGSDAKVDVFFDSVGSRTLVLGYARLEVL